MESKIKIFGHPIHPMLVTIPLGLFIGSIILDTIYLITAMPVLTQVSFYNIGLGILAGLLAAVFGYIDWVNIPTNTRAKQIGGMHGLGNVVVVLMFGISWLLRRGDFNFVPSLMALAFSYGGILLGSVTAWLGGELVFRLSVGVDSDANLNAPSSLSNQPAKAVRTTRKPSRTERESHKPIRR